jgi:hypothetical protein
MGVARTADVFTLADHTDQVKLSRLSYLRMDISRQGGLSNYSTTFTASCGDSAGWTGLQILCFAGIQKVQRGKSLNTKYQHYASVGSNRKWLNEARTV